MSESLILAVEEHEMLYAPSHREYTVQFTHECGILHGDPSSVVSRAPRHVVGVNSFAYRSPFPASLTPDVNATAGGKVPRRAISRRNTA